VTLENYLEVLADASKPLKHADLTRLSSVDSEDLRTLEATWVQVGLQRRVQIVTRMAELAEDDLTLDFTPIFVMALKDPDEQVRERSVAGLWECEDRHLISPLIKLLQCDEAESVRATAAQGLGNFASLAEGYKLPPKDRDRILQVLLETLANTSETLLVRRRAMEAVSPISAEAVTQVIQRAYEDADPEMRRSAVYAMGRNADPIWFSVILKEIGSSEAGMRYEAACACGELGQEAAIPRMFPLLRDDDMEVRLGAIRALGAIGGSVAKKALASCARSPDEIVREAAQDALEQADFNADPLSFTFTP
jgi:HEAT repeat protein